MNTTEKTQGLPGRTGIADMTTKSYNGHKNHAQWNQSRWLNNDYGLYQMMLEHVNNCSGTKDKAAQNVLDELHSMDITHTPDGVKWSKAGIRAAMVGL